MKMNKKVLALALAALVATGSATISAANGNDEQKPCTEQSKCVKGDKNGDKKGDKKGGKGARGRHDQKGKKGHGNIFQGVELTADQQTAIKALREKQQEAAKAERQKNHEAFMNDLKSILTPEQYQQVEQNTAKMKEARAARQDKDGKEAKGQRGERRQQQKDGKKMQQQTPRS